MKADNLKRRITTVHIIFVGFEGLGDNLTPGQIDTADNLNRGQFDTGQFDTG